MAVVADLIKCFEDALQKAQDITSKLVEDSAKAYDGWKSDQPEPSLAFESFDFSRHLAEGIINACFNSASSGSLIIPVVSGGYPSVPSGSWLGSSQAMCTWSLEDGTQSYIDNVVSGLADMESQASSSAITEIQRVTEFASLISDEVHSMLISGKISTLAPVTGVFTVPGTPPVSSSVSISFSGKLSGSSTVFSSSLVSAITAPGSNAVIASAIGAAFITHCLLLAGNVTGDSPGDLCVGASVPGAGLVVA